MDYAASSGDERGYVVKIERKKQQNNMSSVYRGEYYPAFMLWNVINTCRDLFPFPCCDILFAVTLHRPRKPEFVWRSMHISPVFGDGSLTPPHMRRATLCSSRRSRILPILS
jgi:hypothetical protein